ncbi:transporter [Motiliproteus coralliicola]|nr:transporter [Motiliproteus coralliicola]
MVRVIRVRRFAPVLLSLAIAETTVAQTLEEKIELLEQALAQQQQRLEQQQQQLREQQDRIQLQKRKLEDQQLGLELLRSDVLMQSRGAGPAQPAQQSGQIQLAENQQQPKPVGQAPKQSQQQRRPVVAELAEVGGVLTPKGVLVLEPSLQYAHSDVNRVTFRGIEILSSLGIGILEAVDADRDTLTASLTGRLGVTQRLELELKVPFVSRSDKESALIPQLDDDPVDSSSLDGSGIGDIEAAFHYQLNNGEDGWPYFILNGRLKLANGRGPFDVDRDDEGIGRELATGSGFYSFEPSITALYPSAPAVFFANLGYLFNISDDVDKIIGAGSDAGAQEIGKVDPGDAVRMSFGMGYSINERAAFTLGFKNDWIQATKTTINGVELSSSQLNIGSILMGYSYQLKPNVGINLNLEFGITDDAPDMLMTFRMPFSNKVF